MPCKYGINTANRTQKRPRGTCFKKPCKSGLQPPCKQKAVTKSLRKKVNSAIQRHHTEKITLPKVLKYLENPKHAPKSVPQKWLGDINGNLPDQELTADEKQQLHHAAYRFRLFEKSWLAKKRAIKDGIIDASYKGTDYDNYVKAYSRK